MEIDLSSITLRPFRLSDVEDLMTYAGDEQVTRNLRWKTLTTKEEAFTFLKDVCIPHPWRRSICIDDRSIGFISVFPWSGDEGHKADMGYGIAPKYWGQGIATEVVKTAVPQVFRDLPHLLRIQAFANSENKASQRVLEKAGFQKEGLLRKYEYIKGVIIDMVVYSFLSTDQQNSKGPAMNKIGKICKDMETLCNFVLSYTIVIEFATISCVITYDTSSSMI